MKKVILSLVVLVALSSCNDNKSLPTTFDEFRETTPLVVPTMDSISDDDAQLVLDGEWKCHSFRSVENFTGNFPSIDTTFDFKGISFGFQGDVVYTIKDGSITEIPLLGFQFETNYSFKVKRHQDGITIGNEKWEFKVLGSNKMILTRTTDYGQMGNQVVTLKMKR